MSQQRTAPVNFQRQRTKTIKGQDLDFKVLSYSQHDSSALSYLGKHAQETRWKVCVGGSLSPIDLVVSVDKMVAASPEVCVVIDGKTIRQKATLREDFRWNIPFRGVVDGIGKKGLFEVRPPAMMQDTWFKATLNQQHEDGTFKATLEMPNGKGGYKDVEFPVVAKEHIRTARCPKHPLVLPTHTLTLCVPRREPLHATLAADNGDLLTHSFARYSPAPKKALTDPTWRRHQEGIKFCVSKDCQQVTTEVGPARLRQFVNGDVFGCSQMASSLLTHSWKIRIGPFSEHTIELAKAHKSSKTASLIVDGDLLVESTAEDLESPEGYWVCQFRFVGERVLDWEMYEVDGNNKGLDSKGNVQQRVKFSVNCTVHFECSVHDLSEARLFIDDRDFTQLPLPHDDTEAGGLCVHPDALMACYSLTVPHKYKTEKTVQTRAVEAALGLRSVLTDGLFNCCWSPSSCEDVLEIVSELGQGKATVDSASARTSEHPGQSIVELESKLEA